LDSVETPAGRVEDALGGSATYFSVAASFFAPVRLVGVVGDDFPGEHVRFLRQRGVDLDGMEVRAGRTFHWRGRYVADMSSAETIATELNVYADFRPVLPPAYRDSDYIFLANIAPELQYDVLDQVVRPRLVVADTMNLWITTRRDALLRTLARVDVVLLNDGEARLLTGESSLVAAAKRVLTYGPARAIIKKGQHGAISVTTDGYFAMPAYPLERVVDPTGAGDSFAGGFIGHLAETGDLSDHAFRRAVLHGTALAAFTVEEFSLGGQRSLTRADIEKRVQELRSFIAV
jgi:sugar/nucleoside kinase (ribokinase family)